MDIAFYGGLNMPPRLRHQPADYAGGGSYGVDLDVVIL